VKRLTQFAGGFDRNQNKYIIYATSGKSYFNPEGDVSGIYYTEDGGMKWKNMQEGLVNSKCLKAQDSATLLSLETTWKWVHLDKRGNSPAIRTIVHEVR
jgi:hypothetical protein